MILYCDSSALIKRYVDEEDSESVSGLWENASAVSTSVVAFAETMSAFRRKHREDVLTDREYRLTVEGFRADYERIILVPINDGLNAAIEELLRRHPLRGFDAIHLASALVFKDPAAGGVFFACFDNALNRSAKKEGLEVIA